jgi:hypothetical protein
MSISFQSKQSFSKDIAFKIHYLNTRALQNETVFVGPVNLHFKYRISKECYIESEQSIAKTQIMLHSKI